MQLRKLTPLHVEEALAEWRVSERKGRKKGPISQRTVHHVLTKNPCDSVSAPAKGAAEVAALDEGSGVRLSSALEGTVVLVPTHLALMAQYAPR